MSAIWDDGTDSSSDGQYFRAGSRARYGGGINATTGPPGRGDLHHPVRAVRHHAHPDYFSYGQRGPYVLAGLHPQVHRTRLRIAEHYTNTTGATDVVIAMCHLLGHDFSPQIRDLKERKL